MDIPPPPSGFQMDAPPAAAAPAQIPPPPPGFTMDAAPAAMPPVQRTPAAITTPEMAARQQMQVENQGRGAGGSFLGSALSAFSGLGSMAERGLADAVGTVAPGAAENMRIAAERTADVGGSAQHPIANIAGQVVGGTPFAFAGPVGAVLAGGNAGAHAYHGVEERRDQGQQISGLQATGDVAGQAILNGALTYLGGKGITGGAITKFLPELKNTAAALAARVGTTAGAEALMGAGTQLASNLVSKYSGVAPEQSVGEGVGQAAATQGVLAGLGRTLHETSPFLARLRAKQSATPQPLNELPAPSETHSPAEQAQPNPQSQPNVVSHGESPNLLQAMREKASTSAVPQPVANDVEGVHAQSQPQAQAPQPRENAGNLVEHTPENRPEAGASLAQDDLLNQARTAVKSEGRASLSVLQRHLSIGHEQAAELLQRIQQHESSPDVEHPARLENGAAVKDWYQSTFGRDQTGDLIETMAAQEPHVLANVPAEHVKLMNGQEGDFDQNKVDAISRLSDAERRQLPPAILGSDGEVLDGTHRIMGQQAAGDQTVRAYVPESSIGKNGIEEAGASEKASAEPARELKPEGQQPSLYSPTARKGAVAIPTRADVAGPGSIYHEEVKPQLDKLAQAGKEIWGGVKNLFPVETGAGNEKAQSIFREQFNRTANEHYAAEDAFESARKGFDKMSTDDQRAFQAAMYDRQPQPTPALQKIADGMYEDTNEGRKALAALGHEAAATWDDHKFNMLWKKDPAKAQQLLAASPNRPGKIEGKAGFLKKQTLNEFEDGLNRGLVPKYDNPVDMFLATKAERGKYIAGVKGMEQLVGNDLIQRVKDAKSIPAGWTEVPGAAKGPLTNILAKGQYADKLKGGGPLVAPEGVARILANVTTPSALGNKAAFRLLLDANNTVTQSMLGLSGFHIKKVSQELVNLSVARSLDMKMNDQAAGKTALQSVVSPFKAAMNGGDIQKMMLGHMQPQTAEQARVIDAMKTQFKARPDREYETQWGRKFQKALDQGGLQGMIRAGAHAAPALNERLMQKGVFGFVQRAKLHMGSELVTDFLRKNPDATHEQLVKETGKISDHLDNVLGLMNRDNLFWNRTARDLATLSTLSVGWNYGSGRALAGGLVDLGKGIGSLTQGGKISDIDTRRISYLATTGALTALSGAALTYMATGKPPQRLRDYVFPPTGAKDRDGHDIRLNTGFYTTDYYNFFHDPIGTMKAKGSPIMHMASDLLTNRDYRGDRIFDSDAPWHTMAGDVAKYLMKSATPLSIQQLQDVIQGGGKAGKSPLMQAAGFAGVKTAPRSLSESDAELAAHEILRGKQSVAGRTAEEAEHAGLKGRLADEVRDKNPKAQEDIRAARQAGQVTGKDVKTIFKRAHEPIGLSGLLRNSGLGAGDVMQKVWPKMSPEERKETQWMVRGKIGRANLSPADKQKYWKQINQDMAGAK